MNPIFAFLLGQMMGRNESHDSTPVNLDLPKWAVTVAEIFNLTLLVVFMTAGFVWPILPERDQKYLFVGVGSVITVSRETELIFSSDRRYGLEIGDEVVKKVGEGDEQYILITVRPDQKVVITGSPFNQNIWVSYHESGWTKNGILTATSFSLAREMAHPAFPGALVALAYITLFMIPTKRNGEWSNLWLCWRYKRAKGDTWKEWFEIGAMPIVLLTAVLIAGLVYAVLEVALSLIFTGRL